MDPVSPSFPSSELTFQCQQKWTEWGLQMAEEDSHLLTKICLEKVSRARQSQANETAVSSEAVASHRGGDICSHPTPLSYCQGSSEMTIFSCVWLSVAGHWVVLPWHRSASLPMCLSAGAFEKLSPNLTLWTHGHIFLPPESQTSGSLWAHALCLTYSNQIILWYIRWSPTLKFFLKSGFEQSTKALKTVPKYLTDSPIFNSDALIRAHTGDRWKHTQVTDEISLPANPPAVIYHCLSWASDCLQSCLSGFMVMHLNGTLAAFPWVRISEIMQGVW